MTRRIVLLMVMLALASTTMAVSAEIGRTRVVTKNYSLGAVGELDLICTTNPSIGGACFGLDIGETTVTATAQDDQGWLVGGQINFTDPVGTGYGYVLFCGSITAHIPVGTTIVRVYTQLITPALYTSCGLDSRPATTGSITAEFYRPWP